MAKKSLGKTVWIPKGVLKDLDKLKNYPRETYGDIIKRLLNLWNGGVKA